MKSIVSVLTLLLLINAVAALRFVLPAKDKNELPFCVRDFVKNGELVVVTVESPKYADGQQLSVVVRDAHGNEYTRIKNVLGREITTFSSHQDTALDVCFHNVANSHQDLGKTKEIDLSVAIGANARDWEQIQASEKLKPAEVQLRKIEEIVDEVDKEMNYLKMREMRLRDTNESTNRRVKFFSVGITIALLALGVWQIIYLRSYFRSKHII